jgi:hypothetical protein
MQATLTHCQAEVSRLVKVLARPFDTDPNVFDGENAKALVRCSLSDQFATRIVQRAIETYTVCPTPAEVYDISRELVRADQELIEWQPQREVKCGQCLDTGFVLMERGEYEGASACVCLAGGRGR